ncbi:PqqD family protein [Granulicoccus phenolivorans]|uniref:PqqD family protein n=1 Tax=Granulicoccus phenolivorans TaxID=266854 RepID=UPI0003F95968|nr:PqqD family protein [Granulicoccus phenolivorans]
MTEAARRLRRRAYADVEHDGDRFVARLPDGPAMRLVGSAGVIWDCFVDGATADEVTAEVAGAVGLAPDAIAADVTHFLDDLVRTGLLEVT